MKISGWGRTAPYAVVTVQLEAMVLGVGDPAVKPLMLYIVILVSAQTLSHQRYTAGSAITVFKTKALDAIFAYLSSIFKSITLPVPGSNCLFTHSASFIPHSLSACVCLITIDRWWEGEGRPY